jgi:hypothetical protein
MMASTTRVIATALYFELLKTLLIMPAPQAVLLYDVDQQEELDH